MTYERFLKIMISLKSQDEAVDSLAISKVDLFQFVEPYQAIINELIREIYGDEGFDWWSWFCHENLYGDKIWHPSAESNVAAWDGDGNPICHDLESTWQFLETHHKNAPK